MDLPYEPEVVGGGHAGNLDLVASQGHMKFNDRYGLDISWSPDMIMLIHINMLTRIKSILPQNGGWVLIKSKRSMDGNFDLTHFIDRELSFDVLFAFDLCTHYFMSVCASYIIKGMIKDNGFCEHGRTFFPSNAYKKEADLLRLEMDPKVKGSYLTLYRSKARVDNNKVSTKRSHEHLDNILPAANADTIRVVRKYIRHCDQWKHFTVIVFRCIAKQIMFAGRSKTKQELFGEFGSYFEIITNNELSWNESAKTPFNPRTDATEDMLSSAHMFGALRIDLANIAFMLFAELLSCRNLTRTQALSLAGIKSKANQKLFLNSTKERLFGNYGFLSDKYGAGAGEG